MLVGRECGEKAINFIWANRFGVLGEEKAVFMENKNRLDILKLMSTTRAGVEVVTDPYFPPTPVGCTEQSIC